MKHKDYFRDFSRYTSLNVLGMIGLSCYILADTFFISKALGAAGLTALNLAIPVYNLRADDRNGRRDPLFHPEGTGK